MHDDKEAQELMNKSMQVSLPTYRTVIFRGNGAVEVGDVAKSLCEHSNLIAEKLLDMENEQFHRPLAEYIKAKDQALETISHAIAELDMIRALINYKFDDYLRNTPKEAL